MKCTLILTHQGYKENCEDNCGSLIPSQSIQDDGGKLGSGLKIATNNFSYEEVLFLADILRRKYNLKVSVLKSGVLSQYVLYISKSSMNNLIEIVKPYFHPSMYYKLNGYIKF